MSCTGPSSGLCSQRLRVRRTQRRCDLGFTVPKSDLSRLKINWNDLRYVLGVGRAGTLSGAARALGVNETTVGRRLAAIEDALGVHLFERMQGGRLPPTEAGAKAISQSELIEQR